jgi:hypothetical protein
LASNARAAISLVKGKFHMWGTASTDRCDPIYGPEPEVIVRNDVFKEILQCATGRFALA